MGRWDASQPAAPDRARRAAAWDGPSGASLPDVEAAPSSPASLSLSSPLSPPPPWKGCGELEAAEGGAGRRARCGHGANSADGAGAGLVRQGTGGRAGARGAAQAGRPARRALRAVILAVMVALDLTCARADAPGAKENEETRGACSALLALFISLFDLLSLSPLSPMGACLSVRAGAAVAAAPAPSDAAKSVTTTKVGEGDGRAGGRPAVTVPRGRGRDLCRRPLTSTRPPCPPSFPLLSIHRRPRPLRTRPPTSPRRPPTS